MIVCRGPVWAALVAAMIPVAFAQPTPAPVPVTGSDGAWVVEQADRADDARIAEHLGRQALWLKNNTHVIRSGVEFVDGTIEFEMAPMERGNFVAIVFRRQAFPHHENIYLRLHNSGDFDAIQYAPRIGSSTWQIYPEFNRKADLPRHQWTHFRLEVRGPKLALFVNRAAEPTLVVERMRSEASKGGVAFWGRVNDEPGSWSAALSNISIRPEPPAQPAAAAPRPGPAPGILANWEIADALPAGKGAILKLPELKGWRRIEIEEGGLLNLNRALGRFRERTTAFLRARIDSAEARTVALEVGYTDDITVFLNGEPKYSGVNGWQSRYPGYLGHIKLGTETVFLPLQAGSNELVLAVSDDQLFGWGAVARLNEP